MILQLKRKDFRVVNLAAILILSIALLAPPPVFAGNNGDPQDGLTGPKQIDGAAPDPENNPGGPGRISLDTRSGSPGNAGKLEIRVPVFFIQLPGSLAPIPVFFKMPVEIDWGTR